MPVEIVDVPLLPSSPQGGRTSEQSDEEYGTSCSMPVDPEHMKKGSGNFQIVDSTMDNDENFVNHSTRIDSQVEGECKTPDEDDMDEDENDVGDDIHKPAIGMEFLTHEDAYDFYNRYALKVGFGIRRSTTHKSRKDDRILDRLFCCSQSGTYTPKEKGEVGDKEVVRRGSTMVGCPALMKIALTANNNWRVSKFEEKHTNHELTSPSKTNKHRSHKRRHRDPDVRALMTRLHKEGLRNTNIADAINVVDGNNQEKITGDQVHQHLRVERRNNMGQNCYLLIKHFKERESSEMGFYFAFEVDNDNTFRSVFWADWRSRTSYEKFNDVIIFDVTYQTNDLNLPFAPFTGINHHRQSTLFGCALLADEKEETFVWLFGEWLKCMGGKAPRAIITDQDPAMGNAIARVFPSTRHRFCDWHLDKNIGEHIPQLQAKYGIDFKENLERLRNSKSIPEAEAYWSEFAAKYPMREKSWLPKLWAQRHSWVSCYLRDVFLARCRTSQRAESINSFFDKYVVASTPVNEFVQQYDRALTVRREAEEKADFETMKKNPVLTLGWTLEETA